jgi:4-amino-4-deoxy-L-arabinose transferase-like glycosyltransferase
MKYVEVKKSRTDPWAVEFAWLLPLLAGLLVFILRAYRLGDSFDIFIDEITYLRIGRAVADEFHVYLYGEPFFLHPPAWFFIEGAYLKLMGPGGTLIEQIYTVRVLTVLAATLSGGLIAFLVQRIAGVVAALVAVLLFALDPFIVKVNSLNMLETPTLLWVLAGYTVIVYALPREGEAWRFGRGHAFLAGVFFGLAILTKDMALFLTLLPLGVLFVFNWSLARRHTVTIAATALAMYAIYPVTAALSGHWQWFMAEKFSGLERFVGLVKITGFGHSGSDPSLGGTLLARLDPFASTYLLLALGVVAVGMLLTRGGTLNRLAGVWAASAYALLAYAMLFGTLEEQFFYFLIVPVVVACAAAGAELYRWSAEFGVANRWAAVAGVYLAFFLTWGGYQWVKAHTQPDNGYESVLAYVQDNIPRGSHVASTSQTGQFLLGDYLSGPWGEWVEPAVLVSFDPGYLLVDEHSLQWNHGAEGRQLLEWIGANGRPVYIFTGRDQHRLVLYDLRPAQQHAWQ